MRHAAPSRRAFLLAAGIGLILPAAVAATTLTVPDQIPTIQLAIDTAQPGDTVHVQPGTYYEILLLSGKQLVLQGSGPESTVLSGAAASEDTLSLLEVKYVDSLTVITGFTFENKVRTDGPLPWGAAIHCFNASPSIVGNRFAGNDARAGGAVSVFSFEPSPIRENLFVGNRAHEGGGIYTYGPTLIEFNRFERNSAYGLGSEIGVGGGVSIGVGSDWTVIRGNAFFDNDAGYGGGVNLEDDGEVIGNTFAWNRKTRYPERGASHIRVYGSWMLDSGVAIHRNILASGTGPAVFVGKTDLVDLDCNCFFENALGDTATFMASVDFGPNDFFEDPRFCWLPNGDLTLRSNSPCLAVNQPTCGKVGAFGEGCGVVGVSEEGQPPVAGPLALSAYRLGSGRIGVRINADETLADASECVVEIFGVRGRQVLTRTVPLRDGRAAMVWDGRDRFGRLAAAGVYFAVAIVADYRAATSVVLLR